MSISSSSQSSSAFTRGRTTFRRERRRIASKSSFLFSLFFFSSLLFFSSFSLVEAKKKKKSSFATRSDDGFDDGAGGGLGGGEETAMDASNLFASVSNQGLLSRSSGKADDYTEVGETPENVLTAEDEFLMQDDGTNGDSPKTAAILAGDLSMDIGTAGSIGGIPEDIKKENEEEEEERIEEMFDEEYDGSHRMHVHGHAGAFLIALVVCAAFVNWAFGSFFVVKTNKDGWSNLPSLELSRDAKVLFNSVDKYDKV